MQHMKQILIPVFAILLTATPIVAETTAPAPEEGVDLMEEGAKLLLRGLLNEMEPAIDELQDFAEELGPRFQLFTQEMGPAFAELFKQVDDLENYDPPVFLPNGDIIMRRREAAPIFEPDVTDQIEL